MADLFSRLGIAAEMARLEQYIHGLITSPVFTLSRPARYILTAGGKRLRAVLCLLAARVNRPSIPDSAIYAAAGVELIHAASLVHDDLIDQSPHRRGRPTIHEKWHHDVALLSGDYLYALAARAIVLAGDIQVMEHIAVAATAICEGEICSVDVVEPLDEALDSYNFKIAHKTAALFQAAAQSGAVCGGASGEVVAALGHFGRSLGMAFQIVDDVLDYVGEEAAMGKPAGGDLRSGLITLPLIYAVAHDDSGGFLHGVVERLGDEAGPEELAEALRRVQSSGGPERAHQDAARHRQEALEYLALVPDESVRAPLEEVARLVVERAA
jgi:heptaprenyl diphosphate synthase